MVDYPLILVHSPPKWMYSLLCWYSPPGGGTHPSQIGGVRLLTDEQFDDVVAREGRSVV